MADSLMIRACAQIIFRDLRLALRQGLDAVMVLMFFVITVTLFPLGVGPEPNLLARMGPGVIWVAALLSTMLSLDRLFQHDYEDGSLELLVLSPVPLEALVLAKVVAHWLLTGLPLIVASPLLAMFMNMPSEGLLVLMASMLLGTPVSSFIGAVGGALTLGARRGGVLVSLLVLPLYIPLLIFGVAAIDAAIGGLSVKPHLLFLGAMLAAAIPLATWAAAAALRQACE
jgi:heme exporter protein B